MLTWIPHKSIGKNILVIQILIWSCLWENDKIKRHLLVILKSVMIIPIVPIDGVDFISFPKGKSKN